MHQVTADGNTRCLQKSTIFSVTIKILNTYTNSYEQNIKYGINQQHIAVQIHTSTNANLKMFIYWTTGKAASCWSSHSSTNLQTNEVHGFKSLKLFQRQSCSLWKLVGRH